jgi:DNA polymerase II small subunit/DNA polymerase delta subunit B
MNQSEKHPTIKDLQDYFESETNNQKTKSLSNHVKGCDKCSLVLSEMAKIDILFSKEIEKEIPKALRETTISKAKLALQFKRQALKAKEIDLIAKSERKEKVVTFVRDYKRTLFQDLKLPAIQASALFVLMGVLTEISRTEIITSDEKIINNEFKVFYSELEGEKNEDF